jgi:5-formyltetrahydrofolate cyclo-ligase
MTTDTTAPTRKQQIREQAHAARRALTDKDERSARIMQRVLALPEYQRAATVMFYIDARAEVRTRATLAQVLAGGKRVVIPWCNSDGELELFRLESMSELELGMYRILEPRVELRERPDKQVAPHELDLILVPGVAFDRSGGRTGHGKGYYDKLLQHARPDAPLIALAFECQMFPQIPMDAHDIFMDKVVTEDAVYDGRGRRS